MGFCFQQDGTGDERGLLVSLLVSLLVGWLVGFSKWWWGRCVDRGDDCGVYLVLSWCLVLRME